jgi:3-oxoacyl-[acyl-carrier-protein] synthase I
MRRDVFIAGRGAISGFGSGVGILTDAVFAGHTALRGRSRTANFIAPTRVAAEFPPECFGAGNTANDDFQRENDLPSLAGAIACEEALAEARVVDRSRIGLILATTKAELSGLCGNGNDQGPDGYASPMRLAQRVARNLGISNIHAAISCACASGVVALAMAERRIAQGEVDRVLVVGTDALNRFILAGFGGMHVLDPGPCRPFDKDRRGVSLGDGAGALVLSAFEHESIGIRIAGHAGANDACHVTGPDRQGAGIGLAASRAIARAGLAPKDIDVLHLHGTATLANDSTEAMGLAKTFLGRTPPAFGTKGQTGHTLGAAGTIETILMIAALHRGIVPGNVGLEQTDVDPGLDLVTTPRQLARARYGLKVASGFGGVQAAMVLQA